MPTTKRIDYEAARFITTAAWCVATHHAQQPHRKAFLETLRRCFPFVQFRKSTQHPASCAPLEGTLFSASFLHVVAALASVLGEVLARQIQCIKSSLSPRIASVCVERCCRLEKFKSKSSVGGLSAEVSLFLLQQKMCKKDTKINRVD